MQCKQKKVMKPTDNRLLVEKHFVTVLNMQPTNK